MKKFQVFRYLKKFRYLVLIIALIGSIVVYKYAVNHQTYVAEVVIEYTNEYASSGLTPAGTNIDVSEICSASVITDVINELRLSANVDTIRSKCRIFEIIPEEEEKKRDALLDDGESYTYNPTQYRVTYTVGSAEGAGYARKVLDSIISNYFAYYSEKYVDASVVPNNVTNVSVETYDYISCVELLETSATEIQSYLASRATSYPAFRSSTTGYSYGDLQDYYDFIINNNIPKLYAKVLNYRLTNNKTSLIDRYKNRVAGDTLSLDSVNEHITEYRTLLDAFGNKIMEGTDYYFSTGDGTGKGSGNYGQNVIMNVQDYKYANVHAETTYDDMVMEYVNLKSQRSLLTIDIKRAQLILDTFDNVGVTNSSDTAQASDVKNDITEVSHMMNSAYSILLPTIDEFNEYNGAKCLSSLTSITVIEGISIKLYVLLAIVLFIVIGCAGAVVIGRFGDFVDYFIYTDRKTGIANRAKCDMLIDQYSKNVLPDNFTCIVLRIRLLKEVNSRLGRPHGDTLLKAFGGMLKNAVEQYGFVGYNNSDQFIALFEGCSKAKSETFIEHLSALVDDYNAEVNDEQLSLDFVYGAAESLNDNTYDMRELLRLAFERVNRAKQ